jgi:hypothetical protein
VHLRNHSAYLKSAGYVSPRGKQVTNPDYKPLAIPFSIGKAGHCTKFGSILTVCPFEAELHINVLNGHSVPIAFVVRSANVERVFGSPFLNKDCLAFDSVTENNFKIPTQVVFMVGEWRDFQF